MYAKQKRSLKNHEIFAGGSEVFHKSLEEFPSETLEVIRKFLLKITCKNEDNAVIRNEKTI